MIKVFRVYQNHSNIGSYFNKWVCDKDSGDIDNMPDVEALPHFNKVVEIQGNIWDKNNHVFAYRFRYEEDDFVLCAQYIVDQDTKDPIKDIESIMTDVAKYIRLNYKNERVSGNLTRLLTQFLANYFKQYENATHKKRKINTLKQGLANVQEMASQTFMTIVERGKAIGELQTEIDTVSHHGHIFNVKSKRLKNKIWSQKTKAYLYTLLLLLVFVFVLYVIF